MYDELEKTTKREANFDRALKKWVMSQLDQIFSHSEDDLEFKYSFAKYAWNAAQSPQSFDPGELVSFEQLLMNGLTPGSMNHQDRVRVARERGQDIILLVDVLEKPEGFSFSSFGIMSPQRQIECEKLAQSRLLKSEPHIVLGGVQPVSSLIEFDLETKWQTRRGVLQSPHLTVVDKYGVATRQAAEERGINFEIMDLKQPGEMKADLFVSDMLLSSVTASSEKGVSKAPKELDRIASGISEMLNPGGIAIMTEDARIDTWNLYNSSDIDMVVVGMPLGFVNRKKLALWFMKGNGKIAPTSIKNQEGVQLIIMRKRDGSEGDVAFRKLYGLE